MESDGTRPTRRICREKLRAGKLRRIAIGTIAIGIASVVTVTSILVH